MSSPDRPRTVAALYVDERGPYVGLPGVDVWGVSRDARTYQGPHPVVAHPPCTRWCRLAGLVEARWGHQRGHDGGTFAAALVSVRRWGGVLEHVAYSAAWPYHGLDAPPTAGGWVPADPWGGWTCRVDQGAYGHRARKASWLYAHAGRYRDAGPPPGLCWDRARGEAVVSWCANRFVDERPRIGKRAATLTPPLFRDLLILLARRVASA